MEQLTFDQLPTAFTHLFKKVENIERLLQEKKQPQQEVDELLTIQQAGELLKLSVPTIYGMVSRSAIPVMKRSKRLYFSKSELSEWLKSGRKQTKADLEAKVDAYLQSKIKRG